MPIVCQISNSPSDKLQQHFMGLQLDKVQDFECAQEKDYKLALITEGESMYLLSTELGEKSPLNIDFVGGAMGHRRAFGAGKKQDICRAVGLNRTSNINILDATAGLGRDAFVLACHGAQVTAYEIDAVLSSMLSWSLSRAKELAVEQNDAELIESLKRLCFAQLDSSSALAASSFDVVYLDPMFPHRDKSAKVKKEMQILQQLLLNIASNPEQLFQSCWQAAKSRLVIKRPSKALPFADQKPTHQIIGKSIRYDVYVKAALPE